MTHPLYLVFSDITESILYYAKVSLLFVVLFKVPAYLSTYIHNRMEGMPYFVESSSGITDNNKIVDDTNNEWSMLNVPLYIRERIGKYGSEIHNTLFFILNINIQNSSDDYCSSIETLRKYIESLDLPSDKTFHTFEDCLPTLEYDALQHIKYSNICKHISIAHPKHILVPIVSMNELYVSCLGADGSDRVFETPHIDGLFAWLPWCIVYRAVVTVQGNRHVNTVFPLSQNKYILETGEYVAFDYNRSIHYICGNVPTDESNRDKRKRIVLKLHYLVYPEWMPVWISRVYIAIHGNYNAFLRRLFLKSQIQTTGEPETETVSQQWISSIINNGTTLYVKLFLIGLYLYKMFVIFT